MERRRPSRRFLFFFNPEGIIKKKYFNLIK